MSARTWLAVTCSVASMFASRLAGAVPDVPVDLTVTSVGGTSVSFTWTGTAPEFRAIYKAGSLPTAPTDGTLVFEGASEPSPPNTATATGLSVNTRYFIAVYGKSAATYSASAVSTSIITSPTRQIAANGSTVTWDKRGVPERLGRFIYAGDNGDLNYFDGATVQTLQAKGALTGNPETVFAMGTAAAPGQIIAGWRRGTDDSYISLNGAAPARINATNPINAGDPTNCEFISIDQGYVFAVFRAPLGGSEVRNVFLVDPSNGNATNLTNDTTAFGAFHVSSSGNRAVWAFKDGSGLYKLQYFDGSTISELDSDIGEEPKISHGRIVYARNVAPDRAEIYLYDTNLPSPAPVALTNDATKTNDSPQTDGWHAAWVRRNANGTGPEIVLNGGVQVTSGNFAQLEFGAPPFGLDRGQLLWRDTSNALHHLTSFSEQLVDKATATNTTTPWLADGNVVFFDSNATPKTVYLFSGTSPDDAEQPLAPMTVRAVPSGSSVTLTWDAIVGATGYNIYYAAQSGVTHSNYTSLSHGTRITGITSNSQTINGLIPNSVYYFVVTTVEGFGEGPESREVSAALIGTPSWTSVGGLTGIEVASVAGDRTVPNTAYASAGNFPAGPFNTYISTDTGATWTALGGGIQGQNVRAVAADNGHVFASTRNGPIYRSLNSGGTWTNVAATATSGQITQALAIDPAIPNTIVAGDFTLLTYNGGANDSNVIRTDDGGATWFHTPQTTTFGGSLATFALAFDPTHSSTLFLSGNGTPNVAKSIAGGAGWTDAVPAGGYVYAIAVDPRNASTVYAGIQQPSGTRGVWKSVNGGATWTVTGLTGVAVHALVIDPADSNVLHAGTETGYYYSINGGTSWTQLNTGLPNVDAQFIQTLAMAGNHRVIAGTYSGIYLLDLAAALSQIDPPAHVSATTVSRTLSTSNIQIMWDAVSGATAYDVYRRSQFLDSFGLLAPNVAGLTYTDTVNSGSSDTLRKTFEYAVVAKNPSATSSDSARDIATTIDPAVLSAGNTTIQFAHLDDLRKGLNALRSFRDPGMPPFVFTGGAPNAAILALHVNELRTALDSGLSSIGYAPIAYTNPVLNNTVPIKAVHFQEIRDAIK